MKTMVAVPVVPQYL